MSKIKIGTAFRICFPKQFCQENGINVGDEYELCISNGDIIFKSLSNRNTEIKEELKREEDDDKENRIEENYVEVNKLDSNIKNKKINEFVSNLEEGKNFYRKCYSKCGLIIKTKPKYVKNYCERCKGQLLENYDSSLPCDYIVKDKEIVFENLEDKSKIENLNKEKEIEDSKFSTLSEENSENKKEVTKKEENNDIENNIMSSKIVQNLLNQIERYYTNQNEEKNISFTINQEDKNLHRENEIINNEKNANFTQRKTLLKDIISKKDIEEARQQNKYVVENINNQIQQLISDNKMKFNSELQVNTIEENLNEDKFNTQRSSTTIEIVEYYHQHECAFCNKYCNFGFLLNSKIFACKECAISDFSIYYQKERRI